MKKARFALFDMDGTLLESMHYWRNIVSDWVLRHTEEPFPQEEIESLEKMSVGGGLNYIREQYRGTPLGEISWEGLFAIMSEHYRSDVTVKPGAYELLEELKHRGIPMGIATGTPHHLADIALATARMDGYFDFLLSPDEFPRGKAEEAIFTESLRLLKAEDPSEVVFFEDQLYAIQTAHQMGFRIIAPVDDYARKDKEAILPMVLSYWEQVGWQAPLPELF